MGFLSKTAVYAGSFALALALSSPVAFSQASQVRIGVVVDGPWERNEEVGEMIRHEIEVLTEGEFDVQFPPEKHITSDWTSAAISAEIDGLLNDPEVDLVLTMGILGSDIVARRGDLPKPVVAPFIIDAELSGIPSRDGASGVKNLSYLSLPARVLTDIKLFHEIVTFDKLTLLVNREVWGSLSQLSPRLAAVLEELRIALEVLPVGRSIDSTLPTLTETTEAVYLAPLLHLEKGHFDRLIDRLIDQKIPSFSLLGIEEVKRGVLASAGPDLFPRVARRVALTVQRILLGEEAGEIPTAFALGEQITINMATARKIGISPPFSVITEATLIAEQRQVIDRVVSLTGVMREAVDKNLDLAAQHKFVAAGAENVRLARAALLPHVEVATLATAIDADRAEASFGSQAERTWSGTLGASQLLFSERAWANYSIQKNVQHSREHELNQLRLDIIQQAANDYLNLLRAKTFESVQKANLKRTRSNFELAKVRESVGYSGPAEVFRWESQIANDRRAVIEAIAQRNLAEIALNRLLHRPPEERFRTMANDLEASGLGGSVPEIQDYLDDPTSFDTFRDFMAQEALVQAPELQALRAAISAKKREFAAAKNIFWTPTVSAQFEVSRIFKRGGAGVEGLVLPASPALSLPHVDDTNWSLGLSASYPLFEGGARFAEKARANQELRQLQQNLEAVTERVQQRIRSALHLAGASRAGIQLSRDAAKASTKNLDLVTDAYSRGAVDILGLLDAQNAAFNANLAAATAAYDFMLDLIAVERALGGFYYFASEEERQAWRGRLRDYFERAGISPQGR